MGEKNRPVAIDLFCGVGGMSLGFEQAGFDVVAAIDADQINVETHSKNFPDCKTLKGDLSKLSGDDIRALAKLRRRKIHVLFGGSPCQGFSWMGKRQTDDPRNVLLYDFARLVRELRPHYFVLENVEGLLSGEALSFLESFLRRVKRAGYSIVDPILKLSANNFGVPQLRRRVFVIGYLNDLPAPQYAYLINDTQAATNGKKSLTNGRNGATENRRILSSTVWDAISDLHDIENPKHLLKNDVYYGELGEASDYAKLLRGEVRDPQDKSSKRGCKKKGLSGCFRTAHTQDTIQRFGGTEPGRYEPISRYYRLTKDGLAPTIRAGSDKEHGSFMAARPIHPVDPRCITVREAARLHSFPDWFQFHPTRWNGFRQIGNSVPPLLAKAVAEIVLDALK